MREAVVRPPDAPGLYGELVQNVQHGYIMHLDTYAVIESQEKESLAGVA
jgi:hypothetical protein